jgi:hypothetical protein
VSAPHEDDGAPTPADGDGERDGAATEEFEALQGIEGLQELEALGAVLRERMHQAVSGLEPHPETLDLLRRAVPVRRRRRNATLAATAVTVFAVGAGAVLAARSSLYAPEPTHAGGNAVGDLLSTGSNGVPGGGSGHGPGPVGGSQVVGPPPSGFTTAASPVTSPSQTSKATPSPSSPSTPTAGAPVPAACQNSLVLSVSGTQSVPNGGVTYETVIGTVKAACTLAGMPTLTVSDANGGTARVPQYRSDAAAAPLLAGAPTGQTLTLQPGDRFEFRFAWVPSACATQPSPTSAPSSAATGSSESPVVLPTTPASSVTGTAPVSGTTPTPTQPTPTGGASSSPATQTSYTVAFSVSGKQAQQTAGFAAACGAALYVTDYFEPDGQPVKGGASPTAATVSATH